MFKLYDVGRDWDIDNGTLISTHKTKEAAIKRMEKEAKKRVKEVYYYRANIMNANLVVYDYGLYSHFLAILEEVR